MKRSSAHPRNIAGRVRRGIREGRRVAVVFVLLIAAPCVPAFLGPSSGKVWLQANPRCALCRGPVTHEPRTRLAMRQRLVPRALRTSPLMDATPEGRSVGIDLGTTNSAVSVVIDGKPVIIRNTLGGSTTPSVVAFQRTEGGTHDDARILVGEEAIGQAGSNAQNTYASVKRLIGRSRKEALTAIADESQKALLDKAQLGSAELQCEALGRSLKPEEISCHVIRKLVQDAERHLGGEKVTRAVITVPAYFTDRQRQATEAAGLLAGLERVKLLREPEAAALAYGLDKLDDELILVFDLGGGTFDVSVLEVGGGIIEVLWTGGDSFLGGDDFDKALAAAIFSDFVKEGEAVGVADSVLQALKSDRHVVSRLLSQARAAKQQLSSRRTATVFVSDVLPGLDLNVTVTQKQVESACMDLLRRLAVPVRQVAIMAGIHLDGDDTAADSLFLEDSSAGGGDLQDMSASELKALKARQSAGRKKARDKGKVKAEVHRVQKSIGNQKLRPFPGGRRLTEVVLVGGGTRLAAIPRLIRALTGIEPRRTIDPDEAVALGAAIQAGIMDGAIQGLEVLSPLQAALLRGFARKKLAEEQGTYSPLMGDPDALDDESDADVWSDDDDGDWFDEEDLPEGEDDDQFTPLALD